MRVGIVCPYSFDVPGGVQAHVVGLARELLSRGHTVSVLAPASSEVDLPPFVERAGKAFSVPCNGSVARIRFGPVAYARVRRWLTDGDFDVVHVHEPVVPSLSLMTLMAAEQPVVGTFHLSRERSLALSGLRPVLRPALDKLTARIAVSDVARRVLVKHLGGDAVVIGNGVDTGLYTSAAPLFDRPKGTVGFVGRFDEPRKGMAVLLAAMRRIVASFDGVRLLVVGPGDERALRLAAGVDLASRIEVLGPVSDVVKARALRSMDVFCAPNLGGESFGIVLAEAMAAGVPIVGSRLESFQLVTGDSAILTPPGDADALARAIGSLLRDPARRAALARSGSRRVAQFDWSCITDQVLDVYRTPVAVRG